MTFGADGTGASKCERREGSEAAMAAIRIVKVEPRDSSETGFGDGNRTSRGRAGREAQEFEQAG